MKRILLSVALVASFSASAIDLMPATVGLHLGSTHLQSAVSAPGSRGWNDNTQGIYAIWPNGLTLGHVPRNSLFQPTTYAGWTSPEWKPFPVPVGLSVTVGAATGYDKLVANLAPDQAAPPGTRTVNRCNASLGCRNVAVKDAIVPLASINAGGPISGNLRWRVSLLAKTHEDSSAALMFSAEWKF